MVATQTELQRLAKIAAQSFEVATRDNGDEFVRITDGSPGWITELVHAAHGDMLPDDYRYRWAADACEFLAEAADPDDAAHEFIDSCVDVYTGGRIAWLASNLNRANYCDEAVETYAIGAETEIVERVGFGMYAEADEVYSLVRSFLDDLEG
jgi:hypothetical protein